MSDELKFGYGRFDEVKSHPLISGPLATLDERNAATIAKLRTQLAAMTAERDSAMARVTTLREALTEAIDDIQAWASYASPYHQQKHNLGGTIETRRNTLEATK